MNETLKDLVVLLNRYQFTIALLLLAQNTDLSQRCPLGADQNSKHHSHDHMVKSHDCSHHLHFFDPLCGYPSFLGQGA